MVYTNQHFQSSNIPVYISLTHYRPAQKQDNKKTCQNVTRVLLVDITPLNNHPFWYQFYTRKLSITKTYIKIVRFNISDTMFKDSAFWKITLLFGLTMNLPCHLISKTCDAHNLLISMTSNYYINLKKSSLITTHVLKQISNRQFHTTSQNKTSKI